MPVVLWIAISFDYAGKQGILASLLGLFESGVPVGVRVSETKLALLCAQELLISAKWSGRNLYLSQTTIGFRRVVGSRSM